MQHGNKTRGTGPFGGAGMVGLWGASSLVRSVQRGTIAMSGVQISNTATIAAVNENNTLLVILGNSTSSAGVTTEYAFARLSLSGTTLTATRAGTGTTITTSYEVIEFAPGVIKSVQRVVTLVTLNGTATQTITAVDPAKSTVQCIGITGDTNAFNGSFWSYGTLTNATTLTYTSVHNTGGLGYYFAAQVVEFF